MEIIQTPVPELQQIPQPQLRLYQDPQAREYLENGGELAQEYLDNVRGNMKKYPEMVTTDITTGEARGSNKGGRSAQKVAAVTFDKKPTAECVKTSGKKPVAHYWATVMGLNILGKAGVIDTSVHPSYPPEDLVKAEIFVAGVIDLARKVLPWRYPEYVHLIVFEVLVANVGSYLKSTINSHTFVDFALTNAQAQEDAAAISDKYVSETIGFDFYNWIKTDKNVYIDHPNLDPKDLAKTTGTHNSMLYWRGIVNERMLVALEDGQLPPGLSFTKEDLKDLDFRNNVVLPEYARMLIVNDWRMPESRFLIRDNQYIPGIKHYFHDLIFGYLTLGPNHLVCPINYEPVIEMLRKPIPS